MKKSALSIGKFFEKEAIEYLKQWGFTDVQWISLKRPNSHFDITAKRENRLYCIEVRYTSGKKFQITHEKFSKLERLGNVLFLLISQKNRRLVSIDDFKNQPDTVINKGHINGLELKRRAPIRSRKSLLYIFSNITKIKIIDFLLDNYPLDFSKGELARNLSVSKPVVFNAFKYLETSSMVKISRHFGKTKLYRLEIENLLVRKLVELETTLISTALDKASQKRKALVIT